LESTYEENGEPEVTVELLEQLLEDIIFSLSNLSAVEIVEHLHENESIENVSEQF